MSMSHVSTRRRVRDRRRDKRRDRRRDRRQRVLDLPELHEPSCATTLWQMRLSYCNESEVEVEVEVEDENGNRGT